MENYTLDLRFYEDDVYSSMKYMERRLISEHTVEDLDHKVLITQTSSKYDTNGTVKIAPPVQRIPIRKLKKKERKTLEALGFKEELVRGFYRDINYIEITPDEDNLIVSAVYNDRVELTELGQKLPFKSARKLPLYGSLEYRLIGKTDWNVILRLSLLPKQP